MHAALLQNIDFGQGKTGRKPVATVLGGKPVATAARDEYPILQPPDKQVNSTVDLNDLELRGVSHKLHQQAAKAKVDLQLGGAARSVVAILEHLCSRCRAGEAATRGHRQPNRMPNRRTLAGTNASHTPDWQLVQHAPCRAWRSHSYPGGSPCG
jgi:hypothetical protein